MKRVAAALLALAPACSAPPPKATVPLRQDFSAPLGEEWMASGGGWQVVDGRLANFGAHNVPLFLDAALPDDVRLSFTAESRSDAVDLKFEAYTDGKHHASGYVVILSGWNNQTSEIARLDEHGPPRTAADTAALRAEVAEDPAAARERHAARRETAPRPNRGEPNRRYRFRFERQGPELRFFVDDALHLDFFDPSPLSGPGHDRFAFNNWASEVYFDDLVIEALP